MPAEIVFGSATVTGKESVSSYSLYVEQLKERLQTAHIIARKRLNVCAKRQKELYDSKFYRSTSIKKAILSGICR